jgi:hypothetical protein
MPDVSTFASKNSLASSSVSLGRSARLTTKSAVPLAILQCTSQTMAPLSATFRRSLSVKLFVDYGTVEVSGVLVFMPIKVLLRI